jgi:hypothetical protein
LGPGCLTEMAPLWAAAGLVVPALGVIRAVGRGSRKGQKEDADKHLEDADVTSFKCERVCTSNRLLKRLGGLAKVPNTLSPVCT